MKTTVFEVIKRTVRPDDGFAGSKIIARFDHYAEASEHAAALPEGGGTSYTIRHRQLIGKPEPLD